MRVVVRGIAAAFALLSCTPLMAAVGKPVVAIYQMDDLARSGQAATFSAMIETAIESTSKFRVIERSHMDRLVGEQARAKAGLVTSNRAGAMGGFEGADFLIYGTITSVSVVKKSDMGSNLLAGIMSGRNGGTPNCNNTFATLAADIKITDAKTGEVKYVTRISETQKSAATCDGGTSVDASALMRAAADKVATGLVTSIYPIQVAAVQGDGILILNYGEGAVQPGAIMTVYSKGEVIRDPSSGEIIANNEAKLGFVRVVDVTGRVSKAAPITPFATAPAVGSIVRVASVEDVQALSKSQKRR